MKYPIQLFGFFSVILLSLASLPAAAAPEKDDIREVLRGASDPSQRGSVYIYGDQSLDFLIPVRVLGAVAKAGVHYIPPDTDLVTLLSLAGGTTDKAEIDKISIKREAAGKEQVINVDLEAMVKDTKASSPHLMANDTILIPVNQSVISDDMLRTMTVVTGIATVVLAVTQISR